jgi:hypothetical protein
MLMRCTEDAVCATVPHVRRTTCTTSPDHDIFVLRLCRLSLLFPEMICTFSNKG